MDKTGAFFAGALCGFVAGVFLAPKSGAENRADAVDQVRSVWNQGQDYCQQGVENFQSSVSSMRPSIDQKNDQLQAKIDAARKIISEQVAKNAAETAANLNGEEDIEVVAEDAGAAVEEAAEEAAEAEAEAVEAEAEAAAEEEVPPVEPAAAAE